MLNAKNIYFRAMIDEQQVSFELEDDGIGTVFPTEGYHKGLNNMRLRAEKIHCDLSITSATTNGTLVRLVGKIPIKTASLKIR